MHKNIHKSAHYIQATCLHVTSAFVMLQSTSLFSHARLILHMMIATMRYCKLRNVEFLVTDQDSHKRKKLHISSTGENIDKKRINLFKENKVLYLNPYFL